MTQALLIPIRLSDSLSISSIKVGLFDDEITPKPGLEGRSGLHQRRRGAGVETSGDGDIKRWSHQRFEGKVKRLSSSSATSLYPGKLKFLYRAASFGQCNVPKAGDDRRSKRMTNNLLRVMDVLSAIPK